MSLTFSPNFIQKSICFFLLKKISVYILSFVVGLLYFLRKYCILFHSFLRLWGEPVNLREQHDALEFFNSLVDSLDEALKALGHPAMLSKVLGGSFADQKICQGCPHR